MVPEPFNVELSAVRVRVHVPEDGNPVSVTLPVLWVQLGCVIIPATGADGVGGWALIVTSEDEFEIQPDEPFTANEYVPAGRDSIVVLSPVPVNIFPPGDLVIVHVPEEGRPVSVTLPVTELQSGCTITPTVGAEVANGTALITISEDAADEHPDEFVTVYVYVPSTSDVIVASVPDPVVSIAPGDCVNVHEPEAGNPEISTFPVADEHVG